VQDNWKVNNRLTIDAGVRFTRQQPQYDQFQQMSNFFPKEWKAANSVVLYTAICTNGAASCNGTNFRNAVNPLTGQVLVLPGSANSAAAIATPIPGIGNPLQGIHRAGDGISKYGYTWPTVVVGPRFGAAYDISGKQTLIFRGGGGIFYDRPEGNTVFQIPGNPPMSTTVDLRNSLLQNLNPDTSFLPVPGMTIVQYDAKVPASAQWQAGFQKTLPWASVVDVSYVGNHGYNRFGAPNGSPVNLNAIDYGTAYLPQNQDPTLGPQTVPGQGAYTANLLRAFRGLGNINQNTMEFHDTYHSIQSNFNRRFRNGFSFGFNYVLSLSFTGNTGLILRQDHSPDGTITTRADQAEYEELNKQLNLRRHLVKANWVWQLPKMPTPNAAMKGVGLVVNDWQLSGIFSGGSGNRYDLNYSYNTGGAAVNLTGSPDYTNGFSGNTASGAGARIKYTGDPGAGCSSDQFKQFNTSVVTGPTYGSVGLESGRNVLIGCPTYRTDLAIQRNIRFGKGGRQLVLRVDAFNAFNQAFVNGRNTSINYNSPTDQTIRNSQFCTSGSTAATCAGLPEGTMDPGRVLPRNAGFGAANSWTDSGFSNQYQRFIQFQARIQF